MNNFRTKFLDYLHRLAINPKAQIKRLFIGTLCSLLIMLSIVYTVDIESQWLFYFQAGLLIASVVYALPGYLGVWAWRMHDVLFRKAKEKDNHSL